MEAHFESGELTMADGAGRHEADPRQAGPGLHPGDGKWQRFKPWQRGLMISAAALLGLIAGLVLPPLVNISSYQRQITAVMARSFGRPVHLSSVELRLLPLPGFVLHDLSVSEDATFGAEPVLSARTVVATVRLFSLWRGKLEISRIHVDEASLNLVRSSQGRWNLESLMMGAAQPALTATVNGRDPQSPGKQTRFPYLEATNSRVNLKNGVEKRPFSLINTDLSLWQDRPGEWSVRLRGQPVRTDTELNLSDTGELRMEGTLHAATQMRDMPLRLQLEWREAPLGQLSRLLLGSDAGWRGDVTADVEVTGTPEAAQTKGRLRATGVGRAEFTPETPLDLDANCSFIYQQSHYALHNVGCDTAVGSGRLHLKAELPGNAGTPTAILEVSKVPLQAGLDLLRTVRSGFAPGMNALGTVNGILTYQVPKQSDLKVERTPKSLSGHRSAPQVKAEQPLGAVLQGALTLQDGALKGGELKEEIALPIVTWSSLSSPEAARTLKTKGDSNGTPGKSHLALWTQFSILVGAAIAQPPVAAQSITLHLGVDPGGYSAELGGSASTSKLRELAYAFGFPHLDGADGFAGGLAELNLSAAGPWITTTQTTADESLAAQDTSSVPSIRRTADALTGTIELHHTQWQAPYLAHSIDFPKATVTVFPGKVDVTSDFVYGNLQGSMNLTAPSNCGAPACEPQLSLRFADLDAAKFQSAMLTVPPQKTLFSPLIDRMKSAQKSVGPAIKLDVAADSLSIGSVTLRKPSIRGRMEGSDFVIEHWDATVLGGTAGGRGSFQWMEHKPLYALEGSFANWDSAEVGQLVSSHWKGGPIGGSGSVQLSGLTDKELIASATGSLEFRWQIGSMPEMRSPLAHFSDWHGELFVKDGKLQFGKNDLMSSGHRVSASGEFPFGGPPKLTVNVPQGRLVNGLH